MAHDTEPTERYLLMWPPYGDHIIFEPHDLHHLPDRIKEAEAQGVFTLLNLGDVQRYVAGKLAEEVVYLASSGARHDLPQSTLAVSSGLPR
jgi:hypothetical protein